MYLLEASLARSTSAGECAIGIGRTAAVVDVGNSTLEAAQFLWAPPLSSANGPPQWPIAGKSALLGGSAPLLLPFATAEFAVAFANVDATVEDREEGIVAEKCTALPYARGSILGAVRAHARCQASTEFQRRAEQLTLFSPPSC